MAQKTDKKRMIILVIVLVLVIAGGAWWTYDTNQPIETTGVVDSNANQNLPDTAQQEDSLVGLNIDTVYMIKEEAIANIEDFLSTSASPDTVWNNFYSNRQFNRLKDLDLRIDIEGYKNNPSPFVVPSSTDEGLEE